MSDLDPDRLRLSELGPRDFARLVRDVPPSDLGELMAGSMRRAVLNEVFARMRHQFLPARAGDRRAVVHWVITSPAHDAEPDRYELRIADGDCQVESPPTEEPRVTLTLDAVDFLRLTSGNANGTTLFLRRNLKLEGDLGLGAGLLSMFDIPKP